MDTWVAIAIGNDDEWESLCHVMKQPTLIGDERFSSHAARKQNEDELDVIIGEWTASRDKWEIADMLQNVNIAAAAVEHLKDMLVNDPQLPDHYQQVRQPAAPEVDIPIDREAARWLGTRHDLQRAPGLGEHNQYVVQEILGRTDEEFVQLIADEVVV